MHRQISSNFQWLIKCFLKQMLQPIFYCITTISSVFGSLPFVIPQMDHQPQQMLLSTWKFHHHSWNSHRNRKQCATERIGSPVLRGPYDDTVPKHDIFVGDSKQWATRKQQTSLSQANIGIPVKLLLCHVPTAGAMVDVLAPVPTVKSTGHRNAATFPDMLGGSANNYFWL